MSGIAQHTPSPVPAPIHQAAPESTRLGHLTRRVVHYTGHVQGVGFRFTVRKIAAELDVLGYVKNLPDGRVQLVVEGRPEVVDQMLGAISDQMTGYIVETNELIEPAQGEFSSFEIRR